MFAAIAIAIVSTVAAVKRGGQVYPRPCGPHRKIELVGLGNRFVDSDGYSTRRDRNVVAGEVLLALVLE